jgi:hypothetical protein
MGLIGVRETDIEGDQVGLKDNGLPLPFLDPEVGDMEPVVRGVRILAGKN